MLNWQQPPPSPPQRRLLFNAHCNNGNAIGENYHIPQVDRDRDITKSGLKKRRTDIDHIGKQDDGGKEKKQKKLEPKETEVTDAPKLESRSNPKESESPAAQKTDYIHVRARRGQATDSHSLAERIRREKISERMKYLQDLVPGCNNITGKASVLDEIINYVQSLQKQVEFLSMKLASVDTPSDCSMQLGFTEKGMNSSCDTIISRDKPSELLNPSLPLLNPLQQATSTSHNEFGVTMNLLEHAIRGPVSVPDAFSESYFDVCGSSAWENRVQEFCNVQCSQGREYSNPFHLYQAVDGSSPM